MNPPWNLSLNQGIAEELCRRAGELDPRHSPQKVLREDQIALRNVSIMKSRRDFWSFKEFAAID